VSARDGGRVAYLDSLVDPVDAERDVLALIRPFRVAQHLVLTPHVRHALIVHRR
jgi:hypothetical protein